MRELVRMMGFVGLAVLILAALLFGGVLVVDRVVSVRSVSTKEALAFTEEKFASLKLGMDAGTVVAILGEPLVRERKDAVSYELWYTSPKEPLNGWGTWDARIIVVSNNEIVEIIARPLQNH